MEIKPGAMSGTGAERSEVDRSIVISLPEAVPAIRMYFKLEVRVDPVDLGKVSPERDL